MRTNRKTCNGFTLVELMVSIVIVAVLAGLAFGLMGRTMKKAKLTGSISRAKDLGVMVMAYATDQNGELPVWHDYRQGKYWWELISEGTETEGVEEDIFKSPSHKFFDKENVAMTISYGWNYPVIGRHKGDSGFASDHVLRLANFRKPSRVLVFSDGAKENSWGYIDGAGNIPDPERYDGKAAGLMLDGSARVLNTPEEFGADSPWLVPVRELVWK